MRGRVMSLYGLVLLGSTPPSGLLSGWMADQFGPRSIMLLSGVSCVAAAGAAALAGRRHAAATPTDISDDAEQAA
jgi:MFS family permease